MSSASEISPEISLLCHPQVICMSSARHPCIVRMRLQSPKYFQLNTRATALLKISNISKKIIPEFRTKYGNFRNFGQISDGLQKQTSLCTECCNLIGSEPLYIPSTTREIDSVTFWRGTILEVFFIYTFSYIQRFID